jgi:hypothetical protein
VPTYIHECEDHGRFEIHCRLAEYDEWKPCPQCKKSSQQVFLPSNTRDCAFPEPIVIHVSADGSVRFPGDASAKVPKGFEKKELRTIREIESFEKSYNHTLKVEASQHQENEERYFTALHAQNRSDLRNRIASMSPLGRDFAMLAMQINDRRKKKPTDCGFFSEILHFDRSNREPMHDERTGWKRKYF